MPSQFTLTSHARCVAAALAFSAAAVSLAACAPAAGTAMPTGDGAMNGAFPVTIESALGDAVIEDEPQRIVTIGWGSADTAVALGTTPVGVEADAWSGDDDGYQVWTRAAIEERGDELPTTFAAYPELDIDAIVELDPDLILAPQSGLSQDDFDVLSELAPTVAYPDTAWRTSWDTQIEIIGEALGRSDEAAVLIAGLEARMADAAADHPEFAGLSFAYVYSGEPGTLSVYQPGDPRVDIVSRLGMTPVDAIAELPVSEGTFTSTIGLERADLLDDVDVLFTWFNDEASAKRTKGQPLYARIPAVERGSYVVNLDRQLGMAMSMITPYSVPWALDEYIPLISDAAGKVTP
ncbi:MAG TPA: iron-siderophore ABC transporter substrate-binding protein [Leifsonia sp.]|jgi:iron complex transport system substrate-binding protein|nr:iron-siderophore transporter substrate-binding protein [Microbacteriaceae bacterium]HEV7812622.1 iron-siderophore ABC transporter substrate-binding protein [Leifsonia sp.]